AAGPHDVGGAAEHPIEQRLEADVVAQRDARLIVGDGTDRVEAMLATEVRVTRVGEQPQECRLLRGDGLACGALPRLPPSRHVPVEETARDPRDHRTPPAASTAAARRGAMSRSQSRTV